MDDREDCFVATPTLEAKRIWFSLWANQEELRLEFIDAARAHFHAKARRERERERERERGARRVARRG